jgi:predicted dinucleotide-binding enzyme
MQTKQTIAVIGATGTTGSVISKNLSRANYKLLLFDDEVEQLLSLVQEIMMVNPSADVEAINCSVNASWEADIIVTDLSYQTEKQVARKIREVANQKIVVSITNSLHDTNKDLVSNQGISAAEELQNLLPNSKVVKVFNTSFGHGISSPATDNKKTVELIAGNDKEALQTVFGILAIAGFNPVIAGRLTASRTLEHMQ